MRKLLAGAIGALALVAWPTAASGANGDNLRQINADTSGTACADSAPGFKVGVGLAFDGTNLLVSCYNDSTITVVRASDGSQVTHYPVIGATSLGALAWDNSRSVIWACSNFTVVGTIDPTTHVFTPKFNTEGCFDGLAYDGSDDTIWTSPDATNRVTHSQTDGTFIARYFPALPCGNSGIAVGGPLLYLATDGCSSIYTSAKDFSSPPTLFASFPRRLEDLECDNLTFAPVGAMWSKDAYDNILNAWEIPAGSCAFGGGGPPPTDATITATGGYSFTGSEPASVSGAVATFTDPDTSATGSEYSATIDWGDGSSSTGVITGGNGSFTVTGSHTYADEGSHTITVTIVDGDNASNAATVTDSASISDAALHASGLPLVVSPPTYTGQVATFTDNNTTSTTSDFTATIDWGDGSSSSGHVTGSGAAGYTVSGTHTYASTGYFTIKTHIADDGGSTADATTQILIFGVATGGNFVIGDKNAAVGTAVTFWGAQWSKLNDLSAGTAPAAFKGFEDTPAAAACGSTWSTDPGNSTPPPAGPLPPYMAVIVSSSITGSGPTISGNTVHMVVVKTNPGYSADPGNAGTGTVVAQIC